MVARRLTMRVLAVGGNRIAHTKDICVTEIQPQENFQFLKLPELTSLKSGHPWIKTILESR